ncbi:MAG: plasmid pRiA4b ORF-3 family protein [Candidatus Scalindua rubra]|nr:plasmid pRiA4b ORF-3 family protein [Candidatus Scalindua rubra]
MAFNIDFHLYIQKIIGFDNDHLFELFVGKSWRKRERVFGDEHGFEKSEGLDTMLNEVCPLTGSKPYYHFDFGDSWMFKIKKSRKKKDVEKGITYPRVIESEGENPDQCPGWE